MKKTKILLLTSNNSAHPRSKSIRDALISSVELVDHFAVKNNKLYIKFINYLTGRNFYLNTLFHIKHYLHYDIIILQNLHTLLAAPVLKYFDKRVIYDTLDDYPKLNKYNLGKKYPKISYLFYALSNVADHIESFIIRHSTDAVTVNSEYLYSKIKSDNKFLIYYCSPFNLTQTSFSLPPALLYLGIFSIDKGAKESILIAKKYGLTLHIIGNITSDAQLELDNNRDVLIKTYGRLNPSEVESILLRLFNENFFFGLSLIRSENPSYAVQEANKDIDYLALGVPIIGNARRCTHEKILCGGGIFHNDEFAIQNALGSVKIREQLSQNCLVLNQTYHFSKFTEQFNHVIRSIT